MAGPKIASGRRFPSVGFGLSAQPGIAGLKTNDGFQIAAVPDSDQIGKFRHLVDPPAIERKVERVNTQMNYR